MSAYNTGKPLGALTNPPRAKCKICGCSIFPSDETAWAVTPNPGLVHKMCAEETPPPPS
jgi:hypothetical protein